MSHYQRKLSNVCATQVEFDLEAYCDPQPDRAATRNDYG